VIFQAIYRPISGHLSAYISNIGCFLLQTIMKRFFHIVSTAGKKRRYRPISRPIFKTWIKRCVYFYLLFWFVTTFISSRVMNINLFVFPIVFVCAGRRILESHLNALDLLGMFTSLETTTLGMLYLNFMHMIWRILLIYHQEVSYFFFTGKSMLHPNCYSS